MTTRENLFNSTRLNMKLALLTTALFLMITATTPSARAGGATFGDDITFLKGHTDLVVLQDKSGQGKVAVAPVWQGRVMTSTAEGDGGSSFGWINRELIE